MIRKMTLGLSLTLAMLTAATALAENVSLKIETGLAMKRALTFLASQQNEAGYWSTADHPGLSALAIKAFATSPVSSAVGRENPAVEKGALYLLSRVQKDGGIYTEGEGLANYNTAISMMALHAIGDYEDTVLRAREFVIRGQQLGYEPGTEAYDYYGGVGYGNSHTHSDMVNTTFAIQSLAETRELVEGVKDDARLDWEAAITFLSRCQNLDEPEDSSNRGGFVYAPNDSKAGSIELENGETALRSYGSVSYAGLLSYTYADVSADDPRVEGVLDWLQIHYTLDENPGMDQQGLFFYYMTMAIGLDAAHIKMLDVANRGEINWREELVVHLLEIQEKDGSWQNKNGRWMEQDPNLVTAYVLLSLNKIYPDL
ncbi:prenyltransferase/squalene oxidase repeat-containing protein [Cerasicoccus arenae]|uniref:Cycloartenol synthase n=1 Tax=Cerasicoccus arenae TaxID=424488 RepID=A0A8J3GDG7_9BACT|nr:prenyltransferase/squalene oxidase repeat-containing protein [Cerasicoccus arenae]MBK1859876.1 terpene cyclase/mutase family protein [Cerasicoccus arenae]GHC01401.1 cycloartenol synthase [Cerasicoccus arenae]